MSAAIRRCAAFSGLLMCALAAPSPALAWWDCTWPARVPIAVAAPATTQSNYRLEVTLRAADLPGYAWGNLDADLRVLDQDDATPLTFFVQPRAAGTQLVRLWVLIPNLPRGATRTVYVYYGKSSVASASAGAPVFSASTPGVRLWTRNYTGGSLPSESQFYSRFEAAGDAANGYGCSIPAAFNGQTNGSLYGATGSIAWNVTAFVYVSPSQAGTWSFRWGPDLGLGGALYVDDVAVEQKWGTDVWWNGSWNTARQILSGSVTLAAGYHVVRGLGGEGCCDGGQQLQVRAPGGAWTLLGTASGAAAPSCQVAPATPQAAQTLASTAGTCGVSALRVDYSNFGIYCVDHSVTVTARDAGGNPYAAYTGTVTLTTTTSRGTWSLVAGSGTFADPVADDGSATYTFPGGEATATFALSYRAGPATVTANARQTSPVVLADDGTQGAIAFSPSGFTVTSAPLVAPASGIPTFVAASTAGSAVPVYVTAYGQTPTDATCGVIDGYAGTKALKFWLTRADPATGTVGATVNGTAIAGAEGSAAAQNVAFASGQATVTFKYKDVGRVSLSMKDDTTGNPGLPNGIRGSTGNFVSKPADFVVSNVRRASDAVANPGATTASGPVFLAAGRPFAATVTAVDAEGSTTPNYGRESTPESVRFTTTLVLPASGAAPAVTGSPGAFANGIASGSAFAWNEVGTMRLVPRVADGDYLGAGDVVGAASAPVGRFVPDRFQVATNTPVFQTPCIAGGFGYVGQPFGYAVAPVITATAVALSGTPTTNYTGALFRLTNSTVAPRTYSGGAQSLVTTGLPATSVDPTIVDAGGGVATLTYSAGSGLAYARGTTPVAPFAATISLTTTVVDADGVSAAAATTFGGAGGIAFSTGATQRYGRMIVRGAAGSELLDLPVPLGVQYWLDGARGFTAATDDSCTVAPAIVLRDWKRSLAAGETCVRDAGSPGTSGAGCAAPAPLAKRFRAVAGAGDFNLSLAAPGAGNSGTVTVEANAPVWLKYDWNVAAAGLENPSGLATFGVYQGPAARVYQRELY